MRREQNSNRIVSPTRDLGTSSFESETVSVVMLPRLHNDRLPIVLQDRYEIANKKDIETPMILGTTVVA